MKVRRTVECTSPGGESVVRVVLGVVGDSELDRIEIPVVGTKEALPDDLGFVDELQTVTIPISGQGTDLLVYLQGDPHYGMQCIRAGALIDDVVLVP